jgi:hypothetical protein
LDQLRDLKDDAALLELHKHKGIPWEPTDHGFLRKYKHRSVESVIDRASFALALGA